MEDWEQEEHVRAKTDMDAAIEAARARALAAAAGEGDATVLGDDPKKLIPDKNLAARAQYSRAVRDKCSQRAKLLLEAAENAAFRAVRWLRCSAASGGRSPSLARALILLGCARARRIR